MLLSVIVLIFPFGGLKNLSRSGFKISDQVQRQGVPRIENGAYTSVREYFNPRDNTAIGPQMGF
jgi:predicted nuclease with RNAse H fold